MQDVDPRDVKFGVEVPEEKLGEGWLPVLRYIRDLREQASMQGRGRDGG